MLSVLPKDTIMGAKRLLRLSVAACFCCQMAGSAAAEIHTVTIVSDYDNLRFVFEPSTITIRSGDTIVWVNEIDEEHNVISYPGGFPKGAEAFQSPYLRDAGERFSHTFTVEGTYQYHCLPHLLMGMKGEVIVERRSEIGEFHEPTRAEVLAYRNQLLEWFDEDDNLMQLRMSGKAERSNQ